MKSKLRKKHTICFTSMVLFSLLCISCDHWGNPQNNSSHPAAGDSDGDGVLMDIDNCPDIPNKDQLDLDEDGLGDVCDDDIDGDFVLNSSDNCLTTPNTDQIDLDGDGWGDMCDDDIDGDTRVNSEDNCIEVINPDQLDFDEDGFGIACDCNDNDSSNWKSCETCVDNDNDGFYVNCDSSDMVEDCDDNNPYSWSDCSGCTDNDLDGYYVNCDSSDMVEDCDDNDSNNWLSCGTCADNDSDGFYANCDLYDNDTIADCDDANPLINPGAIELGCDGEDNNCNGYEDEPVEVRFSDTDFESAVRAALVNDELVLDNDVLYNRDMCYLTEFNLDNFSYNSVGNITGIEYANNLTTFFLPGAGMISIEPLAGLTKLESLDLSSNLQLENISALAGLTNLAALSLDHCKISDILPLVENSGIGEGDFVGLFDNDLDADDSDDLATLQDRGVTVTGTYSFCSY